MLPKTVRLALRQDSSFFGTARRHHHQWFVCWYQVNDQVHPWQASVVVGKKVSSLAAKRNLLKRRARQIIQSIEKSAAPDSLMGLKTVFVMKAAALQVSAADLQEAMVQTLIQIRHATPRSSSH